MKKLQAFRYRLKPTPQQECLFWQFAGCRRKVWNMVLELEKENYANGGKYIGYNTNAKLLPIWKKKSETKFLKIPYSSILQQSLRDLDQAFDDFFNGKKGFPKPRKRSLHSTFRYVRDYKIDSNNSVVHLPKIGWVKYHNSREIEGTPKNVTVRFDNGYWYISIQTEREVDQLVHPNTESQLGIDLGIARFATFSNGETVEALNSFKRYEKRLAFLQRRLAKKKRKSSNWFKALGRVQKLHAKIANVRKDFLHKLTTNISNNHAFVAVENLEIRNMSRSAKGTIEKHGRNVKAKSGLNKSILDQGWFEFKRQLAYKLEWLNGKLVEVPPQYTSQKCSSCGYTHSDNRKSQSKFKCKQCSYEANADVNASINILVAGLAITACGAGRA